jgi:hypothetical protein
MYCARVFQISWVRRRDWHILTSGMFTYTNDERFQVLHSEGSDDWTLQIKFVQKRDNGTYECQVSVCLLLTDKATSVLTLQSVISITWSTSPIDSWAWLQCVFSSLIGIQKVVVLRSFSGMLHCVDWCILQTFRRHYTSPKRCDYLTVDTVKFSREFLTLLTLPRLLPIVPCRWFILIIEECADKYLTAARSCSFMTRALANICQSR